MTHDDEPEKLRRLRELAEESIAALDRGEGTTIDGEKALAEFIAAIGRRTQERRDRPDRGEDSR